MRIRRVPGEAERAYRLSRTNVIARPNFDAARSQVFVEGEAIGAQMEAT
jgi:hypothetical protein